MVQSIDFAALLAGEITYDAAVADLDTADLLRLTNSMIDDMLARIGDAEDADVIAVPPTPSGSSADTETPWTLSHVIAHATATAEEAAFLAAEMARGIEPRGRSRIEVPWQTLSSVALCRQRLNESRRMRLATLEVWPERPHLALTVRPWPSAPEMNAKGRFMSGLLHDWMHLGQISDTLDRVRSLHIHT